MQPSVFWALLLAACSVACFPSSSSGAIPDSSDDEKMLTVWVVPHSHCDPGWLRSITDYYVYEVQYIISGVIEELRQNRDRKFIQVEVSFFRLWWADQDAETQEHTRTLVRNGQLKFVLGGESMPDEADSTYEAIINNIGSGHKFIEENFGPEAVPTISWHIDPFGHSSSTAQMYAHSGFRGMVINRIDYRLKEELKASRSLEFVWEPSPGTKIFTHVLDSHYCTPDGYDWEHGVSQELPQADGPPPVITRPLYPIGNATVDQIAHNFVNMSKTRAAWYRTNNLLIPFGCDFNFQNARMKFINMDKLIAHINARSNFFNVRVRYSTLDDYFAVVSPYLNSTNFFPTVGPQEDFFPYADGPVPWIPSQKLEPNQGYWTGFYTSRPQQKGEGRLVEAYLRMSEMILAVAALNQISIPKLAIQIERLNLVYQESSTFQHHDAVTGTEREEVMLDFEKRLALSKNAALDLSSAVLRKVLYTEYSDESSHFAVINPLGWNLSQVVTLFVDSKDLSISTLNGKTVDFQISDIWVGGDSRDGGSRNISHRYALSFFADSIPASGVSVFVLSKKSRSHSEKREDLEAKNGFYSESAVLEGSVVELYNNVAVTLHQKGVKLVLSDNSTVIIDVVVYASSLNATQPSGAYIFRPDEQEAYPYCSEPLVMTFVNGHVMREARLACSFPKFYISIRSNPHDEEIEVAHSIGPLLVAEEVAIRYTTEIDSGDTFYTDTNALRMMKRIRTGASGRKGDASDGTVVAANCYPVNSAILVRDEASISSVAILVGRPVAGVSMQSGRMELLVHRRLRFDDYRGVREPLNDQTVANGQHWIVAGSIEDVNKLHRIGDIAHRHRLEAIPLISAHARQLCSSPLFQPLPPNVHLLTLKLITKTPHSSPYIEEEDLKNIEVLIRLQHLFQHNEHSELSKPAQIHLSSLFDGWEVVGVKELDLDASSRSLRPLTSTTIVLKPQEIRALILSLKID